MNGSLYLMDNCETPAWTSGGYISDSEMAQVLNGSQQQFLTVDSNVGFWSNSLWNTDFCGDNGVPATNFTPADNDNGTNDHYTTLASCGTTREEPYIYQSGNGLAVFVPSVTTKQSGPTWANAATPGTSMPLSDFYVTTA